MRTCFSYTYFGSVVASTWMFAFGAVATSAVADAFDGGSVDFIAGQAGHVIWLVLLIIIARNVTVSALNLYGMSMSISTTLTSVSVKGVSVRLRTLLILLSAAIGMVLAVVGRVNFLGNFTNSVLLLRTQGALPRRRPEGHDRLHSGHRHRTAVRELVVPIWKRINSTRRGQRRTSIFTH